MAVKLSVEYQGDLKCKTTHGPSGTSFQTDAPLDNNGKAEFISPTDMVGASMASCMMTVMGIVARRNELDLTGMKAEVEKEMVSEPTRRIGKLTVVVEMPSHLSERDRKLLEATATKCPVKASLHPEMDMVLEFRYV